MLMQDPNIRSAVLFGHQRMGPGLLVEPPSGFCHEQRGEAYKDLIWSVYLTICGTCLTTMTRVGPQ